MCGWKGRRKGEGRGRSGLCGHGWCVWAGGGRRKEGGERRVVDAGFVLPVAYLENSSNTTNTTWQSVRWHPWLQPKIHPIVRVAKHAFLLSVSMPVYLSIPLLPLFTLQSGPVGRCCLFDTEVQGSGEKRVGQNKLEVLSSSPSEHFGTRPVQVVASRLIINTLLYK